MSKNSKNVQHRPYIVSYNLNVFLIASVLYEILIACIYHITKRDLRWKFKKTFNKFLYRFDLITYCTKVIN